MKPFAQRVLENRRLAILRLLSEQRGETANSSVLHMGVDHLGLVAERHEVIDDLRYLEQLRLITLEEVVDGVYVAQLQDRGTDVIAGKVRVEGVSRAHRGA